MVFSPPPWVPEMPFEPPDSIPISEFMLEDKYCRQPIDKSRPFFTCGISGKAISGAEVKERVDFLARGLAKELGWRPNEGSEWDKVCGVFSFNTVRNTIMQRCASLSANFSSSSIQFLWHGQRTVSGESRPLLMQRIQRTRSHTKWGAPARNVFSLAFLFLRPP